MRKKDRSRQDASRESYQSLSSKLAATNRRQMRAFRRFRLCFLQIAFLFLFCFPVSADIIDANPANYRTLLPLLQAGDTLRLAPGNYTQGLPIWNMNGQPGLPIVIDGPSSGPPAVFEGRSCCNTVSIGDSSYIEIRNIEIDGLDLEVDAVKAESTAVSASHITLDGLTIVNHGANQQIVGISTKCPTWGWIIRRCIIVGAGTGMYLGDSDGSAPFVDGLIEYNLVRDTIGYNAQIKHQVDRPDLPGMPSVARTIIRHNVFSKAQGGATGGNARPNLLVGHWPLTGSGSTDIYEIYGNVFFDNPTEALFQGEGNIALYSNLFRNASGTAVNIQPHNDVPRLIRVFYNTVVASGTGIHVTGGSSSFTQEVTANGSFAATPITGGLQSENVTGTYAEAASHLVNPYGPPGAVDFISHRWNDARPCVRHNVD